jgi:hypothetical protein
VGIRSRFAYVAILALTFALLVPSAAVAAEKQISMDVGAARVAAENLLLSRGINPSDAVFQFGERNYAGPSCPGSGWNCTGASIVVQITTGAALSSVNRADTCDADPCVITQTNDGGKNDARCVERSSAATQACVIMQSNTSGTNRAFVSQSITQSQPAPDGSQNAKQTATVSQSNDTGTNDSEISQTIEQSQASDLSGPILAQSQESHQRVDVCQGGTPCTNPSNGKNVSDVSQANAQRLKARFGDNSTGAIDQKQNTSADPATGGPTSIATVNQMSMTSANDSRLMQSSREIATAQNGKDKDEGNDEQLSRPSPFVGSVTQQQGLASNFCPDSGLCGNVFQTSLGVQQARERQDELQKLQGPPGAMQSQYGPEFCCATQTGSNPKNSNDINQNKVQLHTSSTANGLIEGHCVSAPDGCNVTQKLRQNSTTQVNSCSGAFCAPSIVCQTSSGDGTEVTLCAPCPSESFLCNRGDGLTSMDTLDRSLRLTILAPVPLASSASL